jgi:hypothetical protein
MLVGYTQQQMIPTSELDFDEDPHRQNFVCMPFLSPDNTEVIATVCAQGLPVHCLRESQNADQSSAEKFPNVPDVDAIRAMPKPAPCGAGRV